MCTWHMMVPYPRYCFDPSARRSLEEAFRPPDGPADVSGLYPGSIGGEVVQFGDFLPASFIP